MLRQEYTLIPNTAGRELDDFIARHSWDDGVLYQQTFLLINSVSNAWYPYFSMGTV